MMWRCRKPKVKWRAKHFWHPWFAWYPVRIPTQGRKSKMHKVWLCTIHRRGYKVFGWQYNLCLKWEYKLINKDNK